MFVAPVKPRLLSGSVIFCHVPATGEEIATAGSEPPLVSAYTCRVCPPAVPPWIQKEKSANALAL
jgi:hypothetical protein